ncbi:nickel-dependent lactate racemase [Anaerofustis stercorihominis]|uniref:nickel-dependent lactate racemase n=1 Tax=Anaerofustis stercorihominis TaxID=214853 RepID=UPI0026722B4D|nr:nickel-dependent lactate racemase [Anaerofustis stercorihominis]
MSYKLRYDKIEFDVKLKDENIKEVLESNDLGLTKKTPKEHIKDALDNPIGSDKLNKKIDKDDKVCIIISDITRKWQSSKMYLPILVDELNKAGVKDDDITILSATGTHRKQTEEEHKELIGELYGRIEIIDHVCTDDENMVYMGTTSHGTPIKLNKVAVNADKVIITGGVVYHFLAGFGGGRKSIVPGIAARETIMKHHSLSLNEGLGSGSNPFVRSANMSETNPFHTDLMEAAEMLKPAFLLNVVVDGDFNIIKAFAGDYVEAHKEACKMVDEMEGVYINKKYPFVIATAGGFPKDINLYQGSKTLCNVMEIIEDNGTAIILFKCGEKFGDEDCEKQIKGYDNMYDREVALRNDFSIGAYVGYLFADFADKYNLILVTSIPKEEFKNTKAYVATTLDEALEIAKDLNGGSLDMETALLPHGANTLPKIRK